MCYFWGAQTLKTCQKFAFPYKFLKGNICKNTHIWYCTQLPINENREFLNHLFTALKSKIVIVGCGLTILFIIYTTGICDFDRPQYSRGFVSIVDRMVGESAQVFSSWLPSRHHSFMITLYSAMATELLSKHYTGPLRAIPTAYAGEEYSRLFAPVYLYLFRSFHCLCFIHCRPKHTCMFCVAVMKVNLLGNICCWRLWASIFVIRRRSRLSRSRSTVISTMLRHNA
jgi:hypothetical protein